jgi:hypothetical protein
VEPAFAPPGLERADALFAEIRGPSAYFVEAHVAFVSRCREIIGIYARLKDGTERD